MGEESNLRLGDPVYVVGYPLHVGARPSDQPVWTGGTVATEPTRGYAGDRFLIDARTRKGQSGSAVIAYHPGGRGLRANWQLLGIYSGRINKDADIGSVWFASQLREDISRLQFVTLTAPAFEDDPFESKP